MRILIVEDNGPTLESEEALLRLEGWDVTGAGNGNGGLTRLDVDGFDAIVLDLYMPGLDGFGFLREIRARRNFTPVVVTTAAPDADVERLEAARDVLGPFQVLRKPYDPPRLVEVLRGLEKGSQEREEGCP